MVQPHLKCTTTIEVMKLGGLFVKLPAMCVINLAECYKTHFSFVLWYVSFVLSCSHSFTVSDMLLLVA